MLMSDPPREQLVTSSDLVRRFGLWQERAAREPVYVLHRGRPRFVLTSVDVMQALCAPLSGVTIDEAPRLTALLDGTADLIVIANPDGRVLTSSRAARAHFGAFVAPGATLAAICDETTQPILAGTLARVIASGVSDHIELPSAARNGRLLGLSVAPYPDGVILFGTDESIATELRAARAEVAALNQVLATGLDLALARVNLRGFIDRPGDDLATLTGLSIKALATVRFAMLIDIADRNAVTEAIEAVMADATPRRVDATLLVNRGAPVRVRIGLAARRPSLAIEGVKALIAAAAAG